MTNVGRDIGKSNLDVYINGKVKRYTTNDECRTANFISICSASAMRVILEPSGGYEKSLIMELHESKIQASSAPPYYVRNLARSYQDLAKIDRTDERMFFEYGDKTPPQNQERKADFAPSLCFSSSQELHNLPSYFT